MLRRPASTMAAQYQLPFTLATALVHGPRAEAGFGEEARADPRIAALEAKVTATLDPEHEAAFPLHFGSSITLTLTDGATRTARVPDSLGTAARPLPLAALAEKADGLLKAAGALVRARELLPLCDGLAQAPAVQPLLEILSHG